MHSDAAQWNNNIIYPLFEPKMALTVKFGSKSSWLMELAGNSQTKSFPSGDGTAKKCDLCWQPYAGHVTRSLIAYWLVGDTVFRFQLDEFLRNFIWNTHTTGLSLSYANRVFGPRFFPSLQSHVPCSSDESYRTSTQPTRNREISAKKTFKYVHLEMNVT